MSVTDFGKGDDLNRFLSPASFWLPERVVQSAWLQHAPFAFWLIEALRPRSVVELGTHNGFSYLAFCQAVQRLQEATRCYAVDTWAGDEHAGRYPQQVLQNLQSYHDPRYAGFSRLVQARFDVAVSHFADASVDLLHVDGRHFYADAKEDFETWAPKLSDRAVVIFHDTNVRERDFGVWRLWREVSDRRPAFEFLHGHGLGVLGYGSDLPERVRDFLEHAPQQSDLVRQTYFRLGAAISDRFELEARREVSRERAPGPPVAQPAPTSAPTGGPTLHIHLAAMVPRFLDVRTTLPLRELGRAPGIATSLSMQMIELPRLAVDQPKILVLQRARVRKDDTWRKAIADILARGWVLVTELDDHPELVAAVHNRPFSDEMWDSVRLALAVQTSTPAMAEAIRVHNPEVAVFPNAAFKVVDAVRPPAVDGRVRVFFGALNRENYSRQIGAALAPYAAAHREIEFTVVHDRAFFDALGECTKTFHPATSYDHYLELMGACDIALMPLEGRAGERFKSDVKWVEASSLGLATVASPVVYAATIRHEQNGLIADDVSMWPHCLSALVEKPELRLALASAALADVKRDRTFGSQIKSRLSWYESLWARREPLTEALSRRIFKDIP